MVFGNMIEFKWVAFQMIPWKYINASTRDLHFLIILIEDIACTQ